jgi:hypothetical protein
LRIAALFALMEERRVEAPEFAVVALLETSFEDAVREEAELTEEALNVAVVVPPL